jgi:hypothetical protein
MTNVTAINVYVHNNSTEFLIVISQTVFFVLLFLILKSALVDRRGMMYSKQRILEERLQLVAIFFSIFVLVGIVMIPLESYEYAHFVIPITYVVMVCIVGYELYIVFNKDGNGVNNDNMSIPTTVVDAKQRASSPLTTWAVGVNKDGVSSSRRPFNF